jgi:hypothetical protein
VVHTVVGFNAFNLTINIDIDLLFSQPKHRVEGEALIDKAFHSFEYSSMSHNEKSVLQRNVADFHPSVWGDFFIPYASESLVRIECPFFLREQQ